MKQHISPKRPEISLTRKRKLSDLDIDYSKQFELNTNYYELTSNIANYKSIKSIQSIDPLIKHSSHSLSTQNNEIPKSMIFEIKDSESPIELDPSLTLFNGRVKPLCDLGYLYSNEQLFNLIQSFGPKPLNVNNVKECEFGLSLDVFKHSSKKS